MYLRVMYVQAKNLLYVDNVKFQDISLCESCNSGLASSQLPSQMSSSVQTVT